MKNLVFVLGSGRSGTKLMSKIFSGQSHITPNHEYVRDYYQRDAALYSMGKLDFSTMAQILDEVYGSALYYCDTKYFLDSSNKLVNVADVLVKKFPMAKYIHLYRDGRKVVSSFYNKLGYNIYTDKCIDALFEWVEDTSGELPMPPPNEEYWWPLPRLENDRTEFRKYDQFQRCCYHWVESNRKIIEALEQVENKVNLKLEDLTANSEIAKKFFDYLEINFNESQMKILEKPTHVYVPIDYEFSKQQQIHFKKICHPMMDRLGYDVESEVYKMGY